MSRFTTFLLILLVFAFIALFMSAQFLFPAASIQECNKLLSKDKNILVAYESYQPTAYERCVMSVAYIKKQAGLCRYISDSYERSDCYEAVENPEAVEYYDYDYGYRSLDSYIKSCGKNPFPDDYYCNAVIFAERGK